MIDEDRSPEPSRGAPPTRPMPVPLTPAQAAMSAANRKRDREHNHLVEVLATDDGRALIWRILEQCNPYAMNDKGTEYQRGVQEGQRRIGNWIITLIESADTLGYANLIIDDAQRQAKIRDVERAIQMGEQAKINEIESRMTYWDRFRRYILRK